MIRILHSGEAFQILFEKKTTLKNIYFLGYSYGDVIYCIRWC